MNTPTSKQNTARHRDFWDSLQNDMLTSNYKLTRDELMSYFERSIMFTCFIRGASPFEMMGYQKIFQLKDNCYIIALQLHTQNSNVPTKDDLDEYIIYQLLKKQFNNKHMTALVAPLYLNKTCILVSDSRNTSEINYPSEGTAICKSILKDLSDELSITATAGIGSVQTIFSIYTSFEEATSCLPYCNPNQIIHIDNVKKTVNENHFDYLETEKHMYDSIRLRKSDAYDYFSLIMDWLKPLSDTARRDKILEILIMTSHTLRIDDYQSQRSLNYIELAREAMVLEGQQLIEWAFQRFLYITGYSKPQSSVDYNNRIVQSTREYLEAHYSEDISLEDAAEQVNISPQYFSKLIKKTTGFNFIDWLSMLRVKKAKELLTNSNLTVKEVCFLVGYKDPNYFSRIFKKRMGITPSEYIKNQNYINNKS